MSSGKVVPLVLPRNSIFCQIYDDICNHPFICKISDVLNHRLLLLNNRRKSRRHDTSLRTQRHMCWAAALTNWESPGLYSVPLKRIVCKNKVMLDLTFSKMVIPNNTVKCNFYNDRRKQLRDVVYISPVVDPVEDNPTIA